MSPLTRITSRSVGIYSPSSWLDEGDGLLASSQRTREAWHQHKSAFKAQINAGKAEAWSLLTGLPRASLLLLGYSVEMYLKAGLVKAYQGCRNEMFHRDIKNRFRHNLNLLADETAFPRINKDPNRLQSLRDMILFDVRYPIEIPEGERHAELTNLQTQRIWDDSNFAELLDLANRAAKHARLIDQQSNNPAFFESYNLDEDGYVSFRSGGGLPPRLTYRLSSTQKQNGETSKDDIRNIFEHFSTSQIYGCFPSLYVFEDGEKKTHIVQSPA